MLVLEGSDCLGKTTVAHRIVELIAANCEREDLQYPIRYAHMSRPNDSFNFFTHYKDLLSVYAVQDRFHLGALVWHKDVMNEHALRVIEGWLGALGSLTVIFYTDDEAWYKRHLAEQPQQMFDTNEILRANLLYKEMVTGKAVIKPRWDFSFCIKGGVWPNDEALWKIIGTWIGRIRYAEF